MDAKSGYRRSPKSKLCIDCRAPIRVLGFAAALAVIVAMLAPLAPLAQPAAAAEDQAEITTEISMTAQDGGEEPVDGGGAPDTQYVAQDVPGTSGLFLNKWVCDDDYDGDLGMLFENCEVVYDFEFEVYGPNYQEHFYGGFSLQAMPAGQYTIREYVPQGFGDPIAFCGIGGSYDQQPPLQRVQVYDGYYEFYLDVEQSIYCNWFNIRYDQPEETYEYGTVTFYKYFCEDLGDVDPYGASYEDLLSYCEQYYGDEVGFELYHQGNDLTETRYTDPDQDGAASWESVASGDIYATEYAWEGYGEPVVYCYAYLPDALQTDTEYFPVPVSDFGFGYHLEEGWSLVCYWFNIPEHDDYGSVTVVKYNCPEAYEGADVEWYQENCHERAEGVYFKLDGASTGNPGDYPTDEDGEVSWDQREADHYYLYEELPQGYGEPVIFCDTYRIFDEEQPYYEPYYPAYTPDADPFDYRIEFDLDYGQHIVCYWYNVPEHEDSTIELTKWYCPDGYTYEELYELDLYELQELCEYYEGVDFELDGPDGYEEPRTTDGDGKAYWDGLETGDYELTEDVPHGYGEPIVWCGWTAYHNGAIIDAFQQPVELSGSATFEFEVTYPGSTWFCDWFNVPYDEDGSVTVYKFNCPEGYEVEHLSLDELYDLCYGNPAEGVYFKLDGASTGNPGDYPTDEDGEVSWDEREADHYYLYEELPQGYGEPVIFCGIAEDFDGYDPAYTPDADPFTYRIEFDLEYGEHFVCYWFNIPEYEDNTVYVKKWVCPEGYDYYDLTLEELYDLCDEVYEGIDFHLTDLNQGGDWEETTDQDGEAWWYEVPSGEYGLWEEVPGGYGKPIVYCGWSNEYEGEYYEPEWWKLYSFDGNPGIKWGFEGYGDYLFCDWFNIPYEREDGSITLYKWLCPAGYDLHAEGADPWEDCTQKHDGVTFSLAGPDGYYDEQTTGDYLPGGVRWEELAEGDYGIAEMLPTGIDNGFVLACEGGYFPEIYPLYSTKSGEPFLLYLDEGQHIVCDWFNVPYEEQHKYDGKLTVYKYWCDGNYVSEMNCELYGGGQKFVLSAASGEGDPIEFVTDGSGKKTLVLGSGEWTLTEIGAEWCHAESPDVNAKGYVVTKKGHESVVRVYNCGDDYDYEPPTKCGPKCLPNTGTGAAAGSLTVAGMVNSTESLGLLMAAGQLAGLAGLAINRARRRGTGKTEDRPAA